MTCTGAEDGRITAIRCLERRHHVDIVTGESTGTVILDAKAGEPRP